MGKGGGGAPQPTTQTVQQSNIPEYARPYFEDIMTRGTTASNVQYQPYTGERTAPFTPLQQQAFEGVQNLGPSPLIGAGAGLTGLAAGQAAQASQYQPMAPQQTYQAPQYQGMGIEYLGTQAPQLQQFGMGPAERVRTGSFAQPGTAEAYMSPYMQNVVDVQQREAQRQADIARTQRGAQAVGAGAFGGSRQAIMEAEAARNLALQKGDIQAQGLQSAFQQAQQGYQTDAARRLQAALANQQAGLTTGQQNLQALLQTQGLGAQTGMQAQQLNQAAQLQAQQQALGQSQAANQFAQQNAQLAAQYGLAGLQAGEQSRQFGANLGMQGAGMLGQLGGQFGQLGQQAFGQQAGALQAQQQAGAIQQAQTQQQRDQAYEEFMRQQLYPQSQLQFLSSLLRGSVVAPQQTMYSYQAQPSMVSQIGGLGLGALGMSKAFGAKEGGEVPGYADGGVTGGKDGLASNVAKLTKFLLSSQNPEQDVRRMSGTPIEKYLALQKVQQLRGATQNQAALDRGVPQGTVMDEMGLAGMDAGVMEEPYAGGGIVAFQYGGSSMGAEMGEMIEQEPPRKPTPEEVDAAIAARRARGENLGLAQILDIQSGKMGLPAALPQPVPAKPTQAAPSTQAAPGAQPTIPPARPSITPGGAIKSDENELMKFNKIAMLDPKAREDEYRKAMEEKFPSELKERLDEYKSQAAQAREERDADRWLAVAMGGFAAAAGQSPYALQNLAQGFGLTAKEMVTINKDFRKAEDLRNKAIREERKADRLERMGLEDKALDIRTRAEKFNLDATKANNDLQAHLAQTSAYRDLKKEEQRTRQMQIGSSEALRKDLQQERLAAQERDKILGVQAKIEKELEPYNTELGRLRMAQAQGATTMPVKGKGDVPIDTLIQNMTAARQSARQKLEKDYRIPAAGGGAKFLGYEK